MEKRFEGMTEEEIKKEIGFDDSGAACRWCIYHDGADCVCTRFGISADYDDRCFEFSA